MISDKEIAEIKQAINSKYMTMEQAEQLVPWLRSTLSSYESAQEEISKLQGQQETLKEALTAVLQEGRKDKQKADEWINGIASEARKLIRENTAMLEVLKRITKIVTNHEEAKYQTVGTVRLIGSIANAAIADIEKGAKGHGR